jgi:hypothetical protein
VGVGDKGRLFALAFLRACVVATASKFAARVATPRSGSEGAIILTSYFNIKIALLVKGKRELLRNNSKIFYKLGSRVIETLSVMCKITAKPLS